MNKDLSMHSKEDEKKKLVKKLIGSKKSESTYSRRQLNDFLTRQNRFESRRRER